MLEFLSMFLFLQSDFFAKFIAIEHLSKKGKDFVKSELFTFSKKTTELYKSSGIVVVYSLHLKFSNVVEYWYFTTFYEE